MIRVKEFSADKDISGFSRWLHSRGVSHRISEENGLQVLWLEHEESIEPVARALDSYLSDSDIRARVDDLSQSEPRVDEPALTSYSRPSFKEAPFVFICLIFAVGAFILTDFGKARELMLHFVIVNPFLVDANLGDTLGRIDALTQILAQGQVWRLVGPDFIHFHWPHLIFNMLLFWLFGGQLERIFGTLWFVVFFILVSAVSNFAQLLDTGFFFGGMSGVAYGIVGFCWLSIRKGLQGIFFPIAIFNLSIFWLVLGYTPVFEWLGMGKVANSAHLFGLVAGLAIAWFHTKDFASDREEKSP